MASSVKFNVPGAVEVKIEGLNGQTGLKSLGWCVDGIEITERAYESECKTDRYGGEQGATADVQILGREAMIRMVLSEFNIEWLTMLETRMPGNALATSNPGEIHVPGTLMFGNGGLVRCLLFGILDQAAVAASVAVSELLTPRNYPFCRVVDVSSRNVGTRAARATVTLKAEMGNVANKVIFWNRVTS